MEVVNWSGGIGEKGGGEGGGEGDGEGGGFMLENVSNV